MQANFRHNLEGKLYNTHPYFYGATEWSQASYDFISSSLIMRHGRDRDGSRWRPTNSVTALKEFPRESANIWPHNIMAEKKHQKYWKQASFLQWRAPWWSVAMMTIRRQSVQSLALLQAEWIPMLTNCTSVSVALSQLVRGRPQGLLQWLGGHSDAPMTRW